MALELPQITQAFVLHFGEMGGRWGINRTVGQIYALLYLSERPLPADEIMEALGCSRSNVSMGLKELQSWRLIRLQHIPGDRREHFSTPEDIWEIFRILAEERRKREVDPTLSLLRNLMLEEPRNEQDRYAQARMGQMHELIELLTRWADDVQKLEPERLIQLLELGGKVVRLLQYKDRVLRRPGRGVEKAPEA